MNHCSALVPTSCHDARGPDLHRRRVRLVHGAGPRVPVVPRAEADRHRRRRCRARSPARLDPRTVDLTFETQPAGPEPARSASEEQAAPFTRTVIQGSSVALIAPTPQPLARQDATPSRPGRTAARRRTSSRPRRRDARDLPRELLRGGVRDARGPRRRMGLRRDERAATTADASGNDNTGDDLRRHAHHGREVRVGAQLRRRQRHGDGRRQRLARPHEPRDARGLGQPRRARRRRGGRRC